MKSPSIAAAVWYDIACRERHPAASHSRQHTLPLITFILVMTCVNFGQVHTAAARDSATVERYQESIKGHPQIVRYYRFDGVSRGTKEVPSLVGSPAALRPDAQRRFRVVSGPDGATGAVHLDDSPLVATPFPVTPDGFTIELRFRKLGPGKLLGNGRTNGMLLAQGNGYWDGLRLWTSYPDGALQFELGQAKPSHAFGMTCRDPLPDGVWHHVAASWDGQQMRVYLNGVLATATAYDGSYVVGTSPLKIGYANHGVGSIKMDIEEVAIYRGALTPSDVLAHACMQPRIPERLVPVLRAATQAVVQSDWPAAATAFAQMAQSTDAPAAVKAATQLAWARALRRQGQARAAVRICVALYTSESAPNALRAVALRNCLPVSRDAIGAVDSVAVYEQLLALKDLSPEQQLLCRLGLAECLIHANRASDARQQYQQALALPKLSDLLRRDLELQMAHCLLHAREYATARKAYSRLASNQEVPREVRAFAALGFANCFVCEKNFPKAALAYQRIAQEPSVPVHLRHEAEQRVVEMRRLAEGLPPRDPTVSRMKLPPRPKPGRTIHVSSGGDDAHPATRQRPLASLEAARDAIRHIKATSGLPEGGIEVVVNDGVYPRRATFLLAAEDSGTERAPIVYRAATDAHPRFVGGVVLDGFQKVTDPNILSRLDPAVRDAVVCLDLHAAGITDLGRLEQRGYGYSAYPVHPWTDLYVAGHAMQLARWPDDHWLKMGKVHRGQVRSDQSGKPGQFEYQGQRPARWKDLSDIWMFGAWGHLWEGTSLEVAELDTERHLVATRQRATYGFREGYPFYFFNVLEELDQPGEWYLDRTSGVVYLIPPEGCTRVRAEFPIISEPMVIMREVQHVTFEHLAFELGRADGLVMEGGSDNLLAGCTVRRFGGNGVIVHAAVRTGLLGCDIDTLGAGGVRMDGGDYKTLVAGDNFVENCHIHDFSRVDRVYAPAVHLDGVGNRITHNLIHDSPHHAMRVEGFEHAIDFNEVHNVVYEYDDQAGIDIYGNPAYRGIVIRHNFWHHIGSGYNVAGQSGIRLDDFISAVLIYGNVFYRCAGGRFGAVQIHGGKDNIADNNLFIDCQAAFSFSPWGEKRWLQRLEEPHARQALHRGGMDITTPPHSTRYPDLASMKQHADRNFLWRNVVVECGQLSMRDRGVNESIDNHLYASDPGFADPAGRDFTLAEDSPVFARFPFRPIPFREIGLYKDRYRATWPVKHPVQHTVATH